jgi:hypothetical protein
LKTNKFWIILLCAMLIVSAAVALALRRAPANFACIYQDGALLEKVDLSAVTEPYTITIECEGGANVIAVENGRICVSGATCSDGSCVRQGWLSGGVTPIVCLPHRLVIELENAKTPDLDAVVG